MTAPLYGPVGLTECHGCQRRRRSIRWAAFSWPGEGEANLVLLRFCGGCVARLLACGVRGRVSALTRRLRKSIHGGRLTVPRDRP